MKKATLSMFIAALICAILSSAAMAVTAGDILKRVKAAEAGITDVRADMTITQANKGNVKEIGYGDILMLQKATISYKKPDKIRYDGVAKNIKATLIQNGFKKRVMAAMIKFTEDLHGKPGKMQDTLDLGFLSSRLWASNVVTVVGSGKGKIIQLKFDPKAGGRDKRHDMVWIDAKTLKLLRREKHNGDGLLKFRWIYKGHSSLGRLPIATEAKLYAGDGGLLGTVEYKNVKMNTGLKDSLFTIAK